MERKISTRFSIAGESEYRNAVKGINEICEKHACYPCLIAEKKTEQDTLLLIRSEHYNYIVDDICDSYDYAVPVSCIPAFIADLKLQLSPAELELMRGIKNVFDPNGLLNPGTVL